MDRLLSRCATLFAAIAVAACAQTAPGPQATDHADTPRPAHANAPSAPELTVTPSFELLSAAVDSEADADADVIEAAGRPVKRPDGVVGLDDRSRKIVAESGMPADQIGYMVVDQDTGLVLAQHNAHKGFIPASVAKVPTSIAALDVLGGAFRFRTVLATDGTVKDGTLQGDLYLWGGGDPMLDAGDLAEFVRALERAGIERVQGRFVYDDSYLSTTSKIDADQPDDAGYNPSVGALSLGFNRVQLKWGPAKGGGYVTKAVAHSDQLRVPVDTVSLNPADGDASRFMRFEYDQSQGGESWLVGPAMRNGGTQWLPVRNPGNHTATVLREVAASAGVSLPEPQPGTLPRDARTVHERRSKPLSDILPRVLDHSNNVATELIGLVATREMLGEPRTLAGSGAATTDWLRAKVRYADWDGFTLANHSGLSTHSRMTPAQMAAILGYGLDTPHGGTAFLPLMPREWETAWSRRNAGIPEGATIRAKTGTMYYARGLAGLIQTDDDRRILFVYFANDPSERAVYDADPDRLAPWVRRKARAWLHKARSLERDLVALWASPPSETLEVKPAPRDAEPTPAADKAQLPAELADAAPAY